MTIRQPYDNLLRGAARLLLAAACLVVPSACMSDDDAICPSSPATVQFHVSAASPGDLNATRAGGDPNAVSGEFMSQLCVLVVGTDNKVVWASGTDCLAADADAATGNLTDKTFQPITLAAGTYTVYAFANWTTAANKALDAIVALTAGDVLTADDLAAVVIDNPAARVDPANGKYIPMSAKETVTVTSTTGLISVGLDRLVGKVRVTLQSNDAAAVKVTGFNLTGFADKVSLFADDAAPEGVTYTTAYTLPDVTLAQSGAHTYADLYVNESQGTTPFGVSLTTDQYGGVHYESQTVRTTLPRNSVYPLTLTLNKYKLDLDVRAWMAFIGDTPLEYVVNDDGSYTIDLFEMTNSFTLTPVGLGNITPTAIEWAWDLSPAAGESITLTEAPDTHVLTGNFSAVAGKTYEIALNVKWTDVTQHERTYTIYLNVTDEFPSLSTAAANRATAGSPLPSETLPLFIQR